MADLPRPSRRCTDFRMPRGEAAATSFSGRRTACLSSALTSRGTSTAAHHSQCVADRELSSLSGVLAGRSFILVREPMWRAGQQRAVYRFAGLARSHACDARAGPGQLCGGGCRATGDARATARTVWSSPSVSAWPIDGSLAKRRRFSVRWATARPQSRPDSGSPRTVGCRHTK